MAHRHLWSLAAGALLFFLSAPALAQDSGEGSDAAQDQTAGDDSAAEVEVDTADPPDDAGASPPAIGYAPPLPPPPPPAVIAPAPPAPPAVILPAPPAPAPTGGGIQPILVNGTAQAVIVMPVSSWENMVAKYGGRQRLLNRIMDLELDSHPLTDGSFVYKPRSSNSYVFVPLCTNGATLRPAPTNAIVTLRSDSPVRQVAAHCTV